MSSSSSSSSSSDGDGDGDDQGKAAGGGGGGGDGGIGRGKTRYSADHADSTAHDAGAQEMFREAHRWAARRRWLETMEVLVCLSHTKPLRRTGIGSSPAMWNFLDNAKLHVEDPSIAAEGGGGGGGRGREGGEGGRGGDIPAVASMSEDAAVEAALAAGAKVNPEGEDWDSFGGADGSGGAEVGREANGFDWEAWEAFASRESGDGYGEIPSLLEEEEQ